jgi:hypothetical protein
VEAQNDHRKRIREPCLDIQNQHAGTPHDDGRTEEEEPNGEARHAERAATTHEAHADMDGKLQAGARDYAAFEDDFRSHHHTNSAERRGSYEQYRPVYRYGYDLGSDSRYGNADWPTVALQARPGWEERNPGTWEEFKDTIRYAWDTVRGRH